MAPAFFISGARYKRYCRINMTDSSNQCFNSKNSASDFCALRVETLRDACGNGIAQNND